METDDIALEYKIRSTLLKYIRGIDRADHRLRLSAFAPQGRMFIDGVQVIGPNAVERRADSPPAPGLPPRETIIAMSHHLHQVEIKRVATHYAVESDTTSYLVISELINTTCWFGAFVITTSCLSMAGSFSSTNDSTTSTGCSEHPSCLTLQPASDLASRILSGAWKPLREFACRPAAGPARL